MGRKHLLTITASAGIAVLATAAMAETIEYTFEAGHPSLQEWLMPEEVPYPEGNKPTPERVELGKKLFFDPRLSGAGNMSCASCHTPMFGWSDGLETARGSGDQELARASMTIVNTAFNELYMWDGRADSLEDQALGPMVASEEMNTDIGKALEILESIPAYKESFETAYPEDGVSTEGLRKAIASFERTVISDNSPFDQWVRGDEDALNENEINGFEVFVDRNKGNCVTCHSAPNFTDNGFHNVGLESQGRENPDPGRYAIVPIEILKGAFKTPTLRDVAERPPFFHDGSARTLMDVVEFYVTGGDEDVASPDMKELDLTEQEKKDLVAFMEALTSPREEFVLPELPK